MSSSQADGALVSAPAPAPAPAVTSLGKRLRDALLLIVAVALGTALAQQAIVTLQRELLGQLWWAFWLRDQLALSAVGYLVLLSLVGLVPVVLHLAWPRRVTWPLLIGLLSGIGAFCALLAVDRVHPAAWAVLALGLGVQLYRRASAPGGTSHTLVRRLASGASVACVAISIADAGWRSAGGRAALRSLVPLTGDAPNVVLLILDTVRAGSLSLYGAPWPTTPALDARARNGVTFEAAYSTAPWTLPSHASLFTGRYPSQTSADWQSPLDTTAPTLAEAFSAHGYATGGFVANINIAGYRSGLERGFLHYEDARPTLAQALLGTTPLQSQSVRRMMGQWARTRWISRTVRAAWPLELRPMSTNPKHDDRSADDIIERFLTWQRSIEGRPFFAFLNLFDAHGPTPPPVEFRGRFETPSSDLTTYTGAIRYMDDAIDRMLDTLATRGLLDRTIVIVASDHGEQFGEHGLRQHGNSLYRQLLHVPLVVLNAPGASRGLRVQHPVSLRDLPATLLDLASVPHQIPGTSLRPLLQGDSLSTPISPAFSELSRQLPWRSPEHLLLDRKSLVDQESHLIASEKGEYELFRYPIDTAELNNRTGDAAARADAQARLGAAMRRVGVVWRP